MSGEQKPEQDQSARVTPRRQPIFNLPPVVADSTLYVFDNDGQLHAFR